MRLIKKRDLEWRSGDAAGLGEGGFSGAVGNIAHMSVEESARVLQGMTLEDAWTRADQKIANEKEEKKKAKNKKKKKKAKKAENAEGADGGKSWAGAGEGEYAASSGGRIGLRWQVQRWCRGKVINNLSYRNDAKDSPKMSCSM